MSTLYAKLKILVAKLYKAEKLYASMRRPLNSEHNNISGASRLASHKVMSLAGKRPKEINRDTTFSSGILIEHANEIRSLEWYEVHHTFRLHLNDILSRGNSVNLGLELNNLWHEFCAEFTLAESYLKESRSHAADAIEKEEYAHLLKISSDLIKRKARIQALKVINDELEVLIAHDKKQKGKIEIPNQSVRHEQIQQKGSIKQAGSSHENEASEKNANTNIKNDSTLNTHTSKNTDVDSPDGNTPSNVIPLRRRVV